jgi:hypothetical protein
MSIIHAGSNPQTFFTGQDNVMNCVWYDIDACSDTSLFNMLRTITVYALAFRRWHRKESRAGYRGCHFTGHRLDETSLSARLQ